MKALQEFWNASDFENIYDYEYQDLLYWEERMGMWCASSILLETDIAFDTYCIFNCRKVLDKVLCVPDFYRKKNFIVKEIVRRLWPELAFQIPNSRDTLINYVPWLDDEAKRYEKELFSGNNINAERNIPVYSRFGPYANVFGFGSTDIAEGDYIKLKYYNSFEVGKYYVISLSLVKYAQTEEADFEFSVFAGSLCLYKKTVSSMLDTQFISMGYVCDVENDGITLCVTNIQNGENKETSCLFYVKDFYIKKTHSSKGKVGYISNQLLSDKPKHFYILKNGKSIVDVLAKESRDLKEEREGLREEKKVLKEEKKVLKEEKKVLKEEQKVLKEEKSTLQREKAELEERIKALEMKQTKLKNEIEVFKNSTSYKLGFFLTKPFRFLKLKLKKIK